MSTGARFWHTVTAVGDSPVVTQLVIFGGCPMGGEKWPKLADTIMVELGKLYVCVVCVCVCVCVVCVMCMYVCVCMCVCDVCMYVCVCVCVMCMCVCVHVCEGGCTSMCVVCLFRLYTLYSHVVLLLRIL